MSGVTEPRMLDKTGQKIARALGTIAYGQAARVSPLNGTDIAEGNIIEAAGIPQYVTDMSKYTKFGITEPGWYAFARIHAINGVKVTDRTTVEGATGYTAEIGDDFVDVAVRFDVAALSRKVTVKWGESVDVFLFRASDLAQRNLDYRVTYYEYDLSSFVTWTYALTTDETFIRYKRYYTLVDGEYVLADIVYGDPVPANKYYVHTKVRFEGMPRNITYVLNDGVIDCPVEIVLPEIDSNGYGAWFEFKLRYNGQYSCTLVPPSDDVHIATDNVANHTEGVNVLDLHYVDTGNTKVWRLISTHTSLTNNRQLVSLEFRTPPDKTIYKVGDKLDLTGASVVATFSDGSKRNVTVNGTGDAATTSVISYTPASGAALTKADTELVATYRYMSGHTTLDKTLTASVPLTVTEEA